MREATLPARTAPASTDTPAAAASQTDQRGRGLLLLILLLAGLVGGAGLQTLLNPPAAPNPYPQLPVIGEPAESADVVRVILADDARTLSRMLEGELLQALGQALDPMGEILDAKFVGATERHGDVLAAYVFTGRLGGIGSEQLLAGVVFRVRDGKVVGVN